MDLDIKVAVRVVKTKQRIHFIDHSLGLARPVEKKRLTLTLIRRTLIQLVPILRLVRINIQEKISIWNFHASKLTFRMVGMAIVFVLLLAGNIYKSSGNSDVNVLGSDSPEITTASGISVSGSTNNMPAKNLETRILDLERQNREVDIKVGIMDKALGFPTESGFDGDSLMESLVAYNLQMDSINDQLKIVQDQNKAIIDFAVALNIKALIFKDKHGNIDLEDGKLNATSLAAEEFVIDIKNDGSATTGEAAISSVKRDDNQDGIDDDTGSDGKSVVVKSKEVSDDTRIFITPKAKEAIKNPLTVTARNNKTSFTVEISEPTSQDIPFDWWILKENKN